MSTDCHGAHVVYEFRNAEGDCLYVGSTIDFGRRLGEHMRNRPWAGEIAHIDLTSVEGHEAANATEAARIRERQPIHNTVHTDHLRTPKRQPCRHCRTARHTECLAVNRNGGPCQCHVCDRIEAAA